MHRHEVTDDQQSDCHQHHQQDNDCTYCFLYFQQGLDFPIIVYYNLNARENILSSALIDELLIPHYQQLFYSIGLRGPPRSRS